MGSFDLTLFKGTTKSRHELLDGQGYLDVEKGSLVLKIDGIISEFRPGRVGPESERPKELLEGEFYFATDTNLLYIGSTNKTEPFAVRGFPYHKLVKAPWGEDVFRFMVDPDNGDDNNDGLTWATAKKTLNGVLNSLPNDLLNYKLYVGIKPGTYNESLDIFINNTVITLEWVGQIFKDANTDYSNFILNNENIQTSNSPITVNGGQTFPLGLGGCRNTRLVMHARDDSKAFWQSGWAVAERWVLTTDGSPNFLVYVGSTNTFEAYGLRAELAGTGVWAFEVAGGLKLFSPAFYGGSGQASTVGNSKWRSCLAFHTDEVVILGKEGTGNLGWHPDYQPKAVNGLYFEDIARAIVYVTNKNALCYNDSASMVYADNNQSFNKSSIYADSGFDGGVIAYDDRYFNLAVDTKNARTIKNLNTGVTEIYLNNSIKQQGDNLIFSLPTSDPQEAGVLWNDNGTVKVSSG